MSGLAVFDSNIIIDHLNGHETATALLLAHQQRAISAITWMEVMAGVIGTIDEKAGRKILDRFHRIEISPSIQERAIIVRRRHRLKLLDAVIYATAEEHDAILFTRDTKDFPPGDTRISVPYRL